MGVPERFDGLVIPLLLASSTVVVSGAPPYRAAIDPLVLMLGAAALGVLLNRRHRRSAA